MKVKLLAFICIFLAAPLPLLAVTRSWTNTAGGNWFVPANWSPNGVPAGVDVAFITNNGTYTVTVLTGAVTVAGINLGGASGNQTLVNGTANNLAITNLGTIRANGLLSVTNGGIQGNFMILAAGQLDLAGPASKNVYALTLLNQGTVNWSGGNLQGGSTPTTVVSNGGLWQITTDSTFYNYWGNTLAWTNGGTLRKSGGIGTATIQGFNFVNQPGGVVEVSSGTLAFNGATSSILGGSWTATASASMHITGGTWTDAGGTASGTGTNRLNGGVLNLRTNIIPGLGLNAGEVYVVGNSFQQAGAITNLVLNGSQLRGTNRVGNGLLTLNSGGIDGQLTVLPGGQLSLATASAKSVYALALMNQGTVDWSGGTLQGGSTPSTVVSNGGLWQITSDNTFYNYWGNTLIWTNTGTVRKSAGSGTATLQGFNFVNQPGGLVEALSGTISFNGAASNILGGSLSATAPGMITLAGGTWTDAGGNAAGTGTNQFVGGIFNLRTNPIPGLRLFGGEVYVTGTTSFQQSGAITNLLLEGSQLRGNNRVGNGTLTINSGGADGQLTIQPGGLLVLGTGSAKNLYSLTLVNQGSVSWTGGTLQGGSTPTTVVSNGGVWQATTDSSFYNYWGNSLVFTNAGILRKSGGSGTTTIQGVNFVNQPGGLIDSLSGTFSFNGAASSILGGSLSASAPGVTTIVGGTWTDAGGTASGSGTNRFSGGILNLRTNIIPGLGLNGGEVYVVANTFQQAGAITNLTLDGSQLRGTNVVGSGSLTINSGGVDGQLTILPAGQLAFPTPSAKNVYSLLLLNQGTVNWSGGTLQGGSTPTTIVSNGGLWQVTGDNTFYAYWGNTLTFTNAGILRKAGGSGTTVFASMNLVNLPNSLIDSVSGHLSLNSANNSVVGGALTATAPALLSLAGGVWTDAGGSASGTGTNQLTGGTLNLRTNLIAGLRLFGGNIYVTGTNTFQQSGAITNLLLEGSQLRGTNRVGSGALTITAGGVDGLLTVLPAGQLNFSNATAKNLYSLTLLNQGTVNWTGGNLQGGSTPSTIVSNGGLWQITGNDTFYNYWGNTIQFTNATTVRKSAGNGTTSLSGMNFRDLADSLIQSDAGILQLPSSVTNASGTLRLNGGRIQSGGTYGVTGGTLEGTGAFGANAITGGSVAPGQGGAGLIGFSSGLNLGAGATLSLSGTGTVPGTQYDQLSVTGAVALADATLQVASLPSVAAGTTFVLILNDGADAVTGTFNGLPENAVVPVGVQSFRIHYAGGSGNDVTLVRDSGTIPLGPLLSDGLYTNGSFQLRGAGSNGLIYTVQATTNFVQWTNIGFATGGVSGNLLFHDTNAFRYQYRFYRTTN